MEDVNSLMEQAVLDKVFPGGVLVVSHGNAVIFFEAYGNANIFSGISMTKETHFDLASLTKPLATTLAILKLVEQFRLSPDQELGTLLPKFKNTEKGYIRIQHLLCHCAGLPDYRPYYIELKRLPRRIRRRSLRECLVKEALVYPIGRKVLYSDLGFMILGWVVENAAGRRLDHFIDNEVFRPLGLENLFFVDLESSTCHKNFAATELCPWRNVLLTGKVHDDNAYVVGGIEGHAGLFGTAGDVHLLLSEILSGYHGDSRENIFNQRLLQMFLNQKHDTERAFGFDAPSLDGSSSGNYFSKRSVGHLGFTGTSFWMDLDRRVIVVLLTNRVHPSRENTKIKAFRPRLHDAIMKNILGYGCYRL